MPNDERQYFVLCVDNCRFEAMTKEQIIAAIAEATGHTPQDVDAAFITKIKEKNHNTALSFWVGTQAEYNAIQTKESNCFYIITDDTTIEDLTATVEEANNKVNAIGKLLWEGAQRGSPDEGFGVDIDGIQNYKVLLFDIATSYEDPCDHFNAIAPKTGNMVYASVWNNKRSHAQDPSERYYLEAQVNMNHLSVYYLECTENGVFQSNPFLRAVYGIV